jgi:hypothetical protein
MTTPDLSGLDPEIAGVAGGATMPNRQQPMSGEYQDGRQVGGGAPSFHRPAPQFDGKLGPLIAQVLRTLLQGK